MKGLSETQEFCRNELSREARAGFLNLRRVPSTIICRFLGYHATLNHDEQIIFENSAALWAAIRLCPGEGIEGHERLQKDDAWKRWEHWFVMNGWRFPSIPSLRLRCARATIESRAADSSLAEQDIHNLAAQAIRAAELRKRVRQTLTGLFDVTIKNRGGGWWVYNGFLKNCALSVAITYGSNYHQLEYAVDVQATNSRRALQRTSYEAILGAGWGQWDYIVAENVDDSMRLLAENITYATDVLTRMPVGCFEGSIV